MIINKRFIKPSGTYIIALSGGPDSVALLHALSEIQKEYKLTLYTAHLDHEWRSNSQEDATFCKELSELYNISCIIQKASELSVKPFLNGSKEAEGRALRRAFFKKIAEEKHADGVFLGHHALDQIETFFIRIIRGATISGLCGMKEQEGIYIRPLLHVSKEHIDAYVKEHQLSYVIDPTNSSNAFLRNRLRNNALPALTQVDSRFLSHTIKTMTHLEQVEQYLEKETLKEYEKIVTNGSLSYDLFSKADSFLQPRIISLWLQKNAPSFTLTERFIFEVIKFIKSPQGGRHQLSPEWCIAKKQGQAKIIIQDRQ